MAKIIILQHSPYEPLGIMVDTLKQRKVRLRFANFYRAPQQTLSVQGYDGLVILGGQRNPDQLQDYPHLSFEIELIREAIQYNKPVLGICLGSQLLNLAIGGSCYSLAEAEFGWTKVYKRQEHPMFGAFTQESLVFQWHQFASQPPPTAETILENEVCVQAFSFQDHCIGLQFHLEIDQTLIARWLQHPDYLSYLQSQISEDAINKIQVDTHKHLLQSMQIGQLFFGHFSSLFSKQKTVFTSRHAGNK